MPSLPEEDKATLIDDIAAVYGIADVLDALIEWCYEEASTVAIKGKETAHWHRQAAILREATSKIRKG